MMKVVFIISKAAEKKISFLLLPDRFETETHVEIPETNL
jgi:hypothetical protein